MYISLIDPGLKSAYGVFAFLCIYIISLMKNFCSKLNSDFFEIIFMPLQNTRREPCTGVQITGHTQGQANGSRNLWGGSSWVDLLSQVIGQVRHCREIAISSHSGFTCQNYSTWLTCFTLHSRPAHITSASVRSCAGPSILARAGTDGCTIKNTGSTKSQCIQQSNKTVWLTVALRHTPIPLSIRLAGSVVGSLQCVACITGVGHYRVVGCTGETALTICGSTRITTVNSWSWLRVTLDWWLECHGSFTYLPKYI